MRMFTEKKNNCKSLPIYHYHCFPSIKTKTTPLYRTSNQLIADQTKSVTICICYRLKSCENGQFTFHYLANMQQLTVGSQIKVTQSATGSRLIDDQHRSVTMAFAGGNLRIIGLMTVSLPVFLTATYRRTCGVNITKMRNNGDSRVCSFA